MEVGGLTRITDAGGALASGQEPLEIEQSYDALDRLSKTRRRKTSGGDWIATTYTYDANGNLASEEANATEGAAPAPGRLSTYSYDSADRPLTLVDDNATAALAGDDQRITTSFDPTGRLLERLVENRTGGSWQLDQRTLHSYYRNGLRKTLETTNAAGGVLETHTLGYDDENGDHANGNRTQDAFRLVGPDSGAPCRASVCTAGYRYDAQERLTRFDDGHGTITAYTLDPAGNVSEEAVSSGGATTTTSRSFVGNQLRSQTTAGATTNWWYDPLGNVDCTTTAAGGQGDCSPASGAPVAAALLQDYSYDRLNRLTSSRQFNAGVETDSAVYVHDPLDRPVAQTERHGSEIRQTTLSYRGPTGELASEQQRDGQGALLVTKRYGYDQLGLKASLESTPAGQGSSRYAYAYDAHGSVSLLTNGGSASAAYAYTPYGKPDSALTKGDPSSTNPLNPYRYTAKRLDSGSGTLDMGARRFHPDGGRFLQHDSYTNALANLALATDPLTGNRYSLAAGNPISYVEVDGHYVTDVDGAGETTKLAGQPAYNVVGWSASLHSVDGARFVRIRAAKSMQQPRLARIPGDVLGALSRSQAAMGAIQEIPRRKGRLDQARSLSRPSPVRRCECTPHHSGQSLCGRRCAQGTCSLGHRHQLKGQWRLSPGPPVTSYGAWHSACCRTYARICQVYDGPPKLRHKPRRSHRDPR